MRFLTHSGVVLLAGLVGLIAGCGNLTCSQRKRESIQHMNQGVESAVSQSYATAQRELELAMTLDPENHRAAFQLGQVYLQQKQWDKAVDVLTTAIKYQNGDPMYHYHLGHAYLEVDKVDLARAELEKALELNKRLYKAHYFLGQVHQRQDRPREAALSWTESCRLNPGFGKSFYLLGALYYSWDYLQESVQVLVQGAQYARDPGEQSNIYYQLGLAYDDLKQFDKAVDAYANAIEAKKDNLEAKHGLGIAYAKKGDKAQAIKVLDEFTRMVGSDARYRNLVASAYDYLNKLRSE
ncbi:MAG: tetratricopeptide repeat protein [Pseudomonadota bacterium]